MKPFYRSMSATAATATTACTACTAALMLAGTAQAQSQPAWPELRTSFQLQGFLPRTTSTARVDDWYLNTPGTTASGEDDYGLSRTPPTWGLAFMKRIGESWRIDLEYLEQRRTADNVTLQRAINAYGGTLAAGSSVNTRMNLSALRIAGGYTLLRQDNTELGVSFGGVISRYDLNVKGKLQTPLDESGANAEASLGLFASSALSPTLRLQGRFEVGPRNRQVNVGAAWRLAANASLGANLRWMNVKVTQNLSVYLYNTDTAEFKLLGPQLTLEVGF